MKHSSFWNDLCNSHGGVYEMAKNYRFEGNAKTTKVLEAKK